METYACYLIAIDSFGDKIIEKFIKEDNDYLNNLVKDKCTDTIFKYFLSNEIIAIEDRNYYKTSCVFFIGSSYNNKCKDFFNEYDLNIIKIFKKKDVLDGKGVYYSNKYEEIFSFLRVFTLPLSFTDFLFSDLLVDIPNKDAVDFFKFNNFEFLSLRYQISGFSEEWKSIVNFLNSKLSTKSNKWFLRIITSETEQIPIHIINELAITISNKLGNTLFDYTVSIWNRPYHEIELIYEFK